jgi:Flp pilus assembly protein CpaB
VNRTRLFLLGSVALALGTFVCFVIYKNSQTRSGGPKEPVIDVVLTSKLAAENPGFGHPSLIPSGMRAVSVRVVKVVPVAGFVVPGIRVEVLLADEPRATTVLENVAVIAVERNVEGQSHYTPVITLLVSPDDAQRLRVAGTNAKGHIQLVLRSPLYPRIGIPLIDPRGIPLIDPPRHTPLGKAVYRQNI